MACLVNVGEVLNGSNDKHVSKCACVKLITYGNSQGEAYVLLIS